MTTSTGKRVVYRNGGTENFTWNNVRGLFSGEALRKTRIDIERMGYPTYAIDPGDPLPTAFNVPGWSDNEFKRTGDQL